MRIIGGQYRSRIISMPKGVEMRPTQDKVREAIFNILGDITGCRVLELFAGSGAFGIEAISRGAAYVTFVDNNFRCVETVVSNLKSLGVGNDSYNVIRSDAIKVLPKLETGGEKFDIIFMDPPYYKELSKKCLISVNSYDILTPVGLVLVEHFKKDILPADLNIIRLDQERRYGDTVITIFRRRDEKYQNSSLPGNV